VRARLGDFFDLRSGIAAALLMGGIVGGINLGHGLALATTAALKQGAYTFLMGGVIMRFCSLLATLTGPARLVLASAILLPSAVTILATFFVHSLKGTPEPVASTIPVALISLPTFSGWALKTRRSAGP
jgi:hypothetical protein